MGNESGRGGPRASVLADLGPLPEVTESDSDTSWEMFLQLQEQHTTGFMKTEPSTLAPLDEAADQPVADPTVDDVLREARRLNRVCPSEMQWGKLEALLTAAAAGAPTSMCGAEFRAQSSLAKRARLREQVEWAAQHAVLQPVSEFLRALPEGEWIHMEQ